MPYRTVTYQSSRAEVHGGRRRTAESCCGRHNGIARRDFYPMAQDLLGFDSRKVKCDCSDRILLQNQSCEPREKGVFDDGGEEEGCARKCLDRYPESNHHLYGDADARIVRIDQRRPWTLAVSGMKGNERWSGVSL